MGRPKGFCLQGALEKALEVFWRRGFAGASLAELTAAMRITRPSLYSAFGNKEELFRKALDLYDATHMGFMREALAAPSSREVAALILFGTAGATAADGEHPAGCLSISGALACAAAAEPIKAEVVRRRRLFEGELARRFERALEEGDLAPGGDPAALASFVMTVSCGIAFQAGSGAPHATLRSTAELALAAWPAERPADRPAGLVGRQGGPAGAAVLRRLDPGLIPA